MKIKKEHYDYMFKCINENKDKLPYIKENAVANPKVKDIDKYIRWAAISYFVGSKWICDNLYSYLNDTHIDTALRQIMKETKQ